MIRRFCKKCGDILGYIEFVDPLLDFTGSVGSYKFQKYIKHTSSPQPQYHKISIFTNSDYESYKNYIIDSANSGSVEIDNNGRVNLIWFANKLTGQTFQQDQLEQNADGVKLVLHTDENKIHAFPTSSQGFLDSVCDNCGKKIII